MEVDPNSDEFNTAVASAVKAAVEEQVAGLKKTNKSLKTEKESFRKQLVAFDGIDVDRYATLAEESEKREKEAAQKKGDFDRLEEQLRTQQTKELDVRDGRIGTLEKALRSEMIERRAIEAIAKAGGRARSLKPHVVAAMSLREDENGGFKPVILDDHGDPRLSAEATTASDFMTADEYVESLKADPDFAPLFDGTGAGGGGATGSDAQGGRSGPKTVSSTDPVAMGKMAEQIASGEVEVI